MSFQRSVLLIGGGGLIGTHLAHRLLMDGHRVAILDDFSARNRASRTGRTENIRLIEFLSVKGVSVVTGDIRSQEAVRSAIEAHRPNAVAFLAALLNDEATLSSARAYEVMVRALGDLILILDDLNMQPRVVLASSSFVYGDFRTEPASEEHPLQPSGVYGHLKLAAEQTLQALSSYARIPYTILRPSAVFGPGDARLSIYE